MPESERWPRWEYRLEKMSLMLEDRQAAGEDRMDEIGRQGWEAVGIAGDPNGLCVVLFKRPILT